MVSLDILGIGKETLIVVALLYGVIIGSFLNVVIYRFHTGKSLAGHSHCLSCGTRLRVFELFPILSYLFLRGRCRTCGCYVPVRYLLVEVVTGLLFVAAALQAVSLSELLYLWVVVALLVVIAVYDLYHYIIPDSLTAALTGISLVWLSYQSFLAGSVDMLLWGVGAAGFGSLFLFTLWAISKGRWIGFGDVKLAFPLGLIVGVSFVFSMIVLSFWIGAAVSLLLVGLARLQRGKLSLRFFPTHLTIKSVVPFAPFLIAGCLFVLFFHFNVLTLFTL